jgi:peptidoglycan/xylan/chitin deacetylase (PgdA/CDA1 family)
MAKKIVNISFDDGFEDIYTHAFPLFRKYQIPFTIYITTDLIEQNILLWWLALEEIVLKNDKITLSTG